MDKFHVVAEQGVADVRVWSHSACCLSGWKVYRLHAVSSSGGNPDGPDQEEFSSSGNPGISSHRGPGTEPVEQPQPAVPPGLSGGSDGGGFGAPPGYSEFVTAAVRSAMEPFLQNMAQVVGEQTAQITVVNQRVEQLASECDR